MLPTGSALQRLLDGPVRPGRVEWIGLRLRRRGPIVSVEAAELTPEVGLVGDRYDGRSGTRHLTLIAAEHLRDIGAWLGREPVTPEALRRNVVASGVNLGALKGRRFRLGSAVLEHTGDCHPCSRMEETLGPGGYNAVRGHGGITARVLTAGAVTLGDALARLDPGQAAAP